MIPTGVALYTASQTRALDALAIEHESLSGYTLMTRAATAALRLIGERWPDQAPLHVVCGTGNNGGDGFVLARLAAAAGLAVRLYQVGDPARVEGDARRARADALEQGLSLTPLPEQFERGVIVDALLGTGLKGEVRPQQAAAIELINRSQGPVVALDIPSGICGDRGRVLGTAVRADVTLTFVGRKRGLYTGAAVDYCGTVLFDDLGIPSAVYRRVLPLSRQLNLSNLLAGLPASRARSTHKGHNGHVLVIGGAPGLGGAALLAARAAARCGAGLVSMATHPDTVAAANAACPEIMARTVRNVHEFAPLLARASVLVIGPGLGLSPWAEQMWQAALRRALPMVIDADALNLLSERGDRLNSPCILTPHPGEAGRLLGVGAADVQTDRFDAVARIATRYGAKVLLKGAGTLVVDDDNAEAIDLCPYGNPGMATGGMGDVLSGVLGALLAQGLSASDAARLGVCVHGRSADLAVRRDGERGLLASDLLPWCRRILNGRLDD